ncbi:hypothetical protein EBB07_19920 [Paenibacillaceae bacterium]|nr:hypothetical protein EBB07_19920 [Paenibacillaceae bacterium]
MLTQLFITMHEMLDKLIECYKQTGKMEQQEALEQLSVITSMNDTIIEEWFRLEEKLAIFNELKQESEPVLENNCYNGILPKQSSTSLPNDELLDMNELLNQGQGYFKLFMFKHAAELFEQVIEQAPDCNLARLFLAMTYMHIQEWFEAQRHFQLIVALTDHPKWQALGWNALGCIQAITLNMEQAEAYFLKAHNADPNFHEPISNLEACRKRGGHLSLYFGSARLSCL